MFFQYETPRLLLKVLRADCAPQVLDFYNRDKELFEMYEIDDKKDFSNAIVGKKIDSTYLIKSLFEHANNGDLPAISVLETSGEHMARSIAGVIKELNIKEPINVILAGSVWAKATNFAMLNKFKKVVCELSNKKCNFIVLKEPPVLGAILWALELANGELPDKELKAKVLENIINYQNSIN